MLCNEYGELATLRVEEKSAKYLSAILVTSARADTSDDFRCSRRYQCHGDTLDETSNLLVGVFRGLCSRAWLGIKAL